MKTLILFSLKRRFVNRMSLIVNGLTLIAILGILNADYVVAALNLQMGQLVPISVNETTRQSLVDISEWEMAGFTFDDDAEIAIHYDDYQYQVTGAVDPLTQNAIGGLLLKSHQLRILTEADPSLESFMVKFNTVPIHFDPPWDPLAALRENLLFSILTAAYFMVLNFIAVNSSEVIGEKTSNVLEMILSRLKPRDHFLAKVITGLSSLFLQFLSTGTMLGLTVWARYRNDRFVGLIRFAIRVFKISPDIINTETVMAFLSPSPELLIRFATALGILMLGMTILLVLIIIVSAHVKSVEEAAMVQGPFYLGLLALYYVSLGLLNPQSLEAGWGKVLSLVPVGSMLLMGMRVLSGTVRSVELLFSAGGSFLVLGALIGVGYPIYRRGLIRQ